MSYILDALRKAERERERAKVPSLETVHELPEEKRPGVRPGIVAAAAVVLCLAAAAFFLLQKPVETAPTAPAASGSAASAPKPAQAEAAREPERVAAASTAPAPAAASPDKAGDKAGDKASQEAPQQGQPAEPKPGAGDAAQAAATAGKSAEPAPRADAPRRASVPPPAPAQAQTPTGAAAASLRDVASGMSLSVHLYSDNKDERMVFINGRKYLEGDAVTADCVLDSITPEGVVLRRGEERVTLRPGSAPVVH